MVAVYGASPRVPVAVHLVEGAEHYRPSVMLDLTRIAGQIAVEGAGGDPLQPVPRLGRRRPPRNVRRPPRLPADHRDDAETGKPRCRLRREVAPPVVVPHHDGGATSRSARQSVDARLAEGNAGGEGAPIDMAERRRRYLAARGDGRPLRGEGDPRGQEAAEKSKADRDVSSQPGPSGHVATMPATARWDK